jgi:hypothetical protein
LELEVAKATLNSERAPRTELPAPTNSEGTYNNTNSFNNSQSSSSTSSLNSSNDNSFDGATPRKVYNALRIPIPSLDGPLEGPRTVRMEDLPPDAVGIVHRPITPKTSPLGSAESTADSSHIKSLNLLAVSRKNTIEQSQPTFRKPTEGDHSVVAATSSTSSTSQVSPSPSECKLSSSSSSWANPSVTVANSSGPNAAENQPRLLSYTEKSRMQLDQLKEQYETIEKSQPSNSNPTLTNCLKGWKDTLDLTTNLWEVAKRAMDEMATSRKTQHDLAMHIDSLLDKQSSMLNQISVLEDTFHGRERELAEILIGPSLDIEVIHPDERGVLYVRKSECHCQPFTILYGYVLGSNLNSIIL